MDHSVAECSFRDSNRLNFEFPLFQVCSLSNYVMPSQMSFVVRYLSCKTMQMSCLCSLTFISFLVPMGQHHSTRKKKNTKESQHEKEDEEVVQSQEVPLPELLDGTTQLLTEEDIKTLAQALRDDYRKKWRLLYNSDKHGKSFNRFCYHVTGQGPTLIIIKDTGGAIFGGFASNTWKEKHPTFYGDGWNLLVRLDSTQHSHLYLP